MYHENKNDFCIPGTKRLPSKGTRKINWTTDLYALIDTLASSLKVRVIRQSRKSQTIHDDTQATSWEFKKTAYYANYEAWEFVFNLTALPCHQIISYSHNIIGRDTQHNFNFVWLVQYDILDGIVGHVLQVCHHIIATVALEAFKLEIKTVIFKSCCCKHY